ncbi:MULTISPECIES: very short patch repair endonuclease [Micromonospora]|uniref:very short patch repair endonuclease n=2 Tax=Micromonospora TaxID=1873 RepID=UPI0003EEC1BF|nr:MULTISPECIES: very short patch repair endonuclease [Micromonospora]EWM65735.1 very short patch repair protein [Micromonospora sp. M42]MBQ1046486.1 very short patch repair endonuclease [Micromonospora sp. C72]
MVRGIPEASWASSPATRRAMQGNRSRNTTPEMALRRALHAKGLRYRVCAHPLPDLRRKIDIVFRPARVAVEVHGCFWHGCPEHHRRPSANSQYWHDKLARNMNRDRQTRQQLEQAGWLLITVWEHDDVELAAERITDAVRARRP